MSVADSIKANYLKALTKYGSSTVDVRRTTGGNTPTDTTISGVRARVRGIRSSDTLATTVGQRGQVTILYAQDIIDAATITLPLVKGDKLVIDSVEKTIEDVDMQTGKVLGTQIFIKVYTKG